MQMSVHAALAAAKKYEDKLKKMLDSTSLSFIGHTSGQNGTCNGLSIEAAEGEFRGNFQAFMQNYNNLIKTRRAITRINAGIVDGTTDQVLKVSVGKDLPEMTIAEVIVSQKNLHYLETFVKKLKLQYLDERHRVEQLNEEVNSRLDVILSSLSGAMGGRMTTGKDASNMATSIDVAAYHKDNDASLVDPLGLGNEIQRLDDMVANLATLYDSTLSNFNGVQAIEIDYDTKD